MDNSRAKSPNIGNVLNARRLARRKLQRSARRDREKVEAEKKEEEEKESLAWKVLSEEQTQALKELTVHELEVKLAEVLSIENYHISLPEACILDYYVAGFWYPLGEQDVKEEDTQSAAVSQPEDQTAENILASVTPGKVKTIVKKVADEVLGNFQAEVEARLKDRETVLAGKIGKLQTR
ncbi:uncharacterized protein LOC110042653 [Orbicella faveolata]|uniref:uncharacterized protein LOC110042653 n=1 Tax=Orbicella faveolata TaxID=48498 RepID=UPI0009E50317|nr:uncharacterized protein LOC110042653 [Orbicella faveolata]